MYKRKSMHLSHLRITYYNMKHIKVKKAYLQYLLEKFNGKYHEINLTYIIPHSRYISFISFIITELRYIASKQQLEIN